MTATEDHAAATEAAATEAAASEPAASEPAANDPTRGTTTLRIALSGGKDPAEALRKLEIWLRTDEDLAPRLAHRERSAAETMGIGYDLLCQILGETLQTTALTLFRAIANHLRNRRVDDLTITVHGPGVQCVLTGRDTLTHGELEAMAARIRQAIEPGQDPGQDPGQGRLG